MEYTDGTINYWLPTTWHEAIRAIHTAANEPQLATCAAASEGDGSRGFISYVAEEVGKEVAQEVGGQIVTALIQASR